ncbi:unnamed protein product [Lactuca virosa]|uniref:Uncharacterized protein n=1 Tax=Lactuca virosa TaxID=75947 RepID=A0AAU9M5Y5_9ASTR|nr:unnamed protein product [Lactuca virosa]
MSPGNNTGTGLRKGAWTADEDLLLKKCIEKYGEGKWHLVPFRTGLNRCRKSCRLRWLNYLRPNIKRGDFGEDEVDLMLRLHKLLGNRWSLIAGRIPGRTANDVKNYWNTHLPSNSKQKKESKDNESMQDTMVTTIKPQPHTFSKTLKQYMADNPQIVAHNGSNILRSSNDGVNNNLNMTLGSILSPNVLDDKINEYLNDLIFDDRENEMNNQIGWSFGGSMNGEASHVVEQEDDYNGLFDFPVDEAMWDLTD